MSAKSVFTKALLLTVLGAGSIRAQAPSALNPMDTVAPPSATATNGEPAPAPQQARTFQLSSWIRGDKYDCGSCCYGNSGPIENELFFRAGPVIPFGSGQVASVLQTGYSVGGGGRTLFFDPSLSQAWTVELGVTNIYNHAHFPSNGPDITLHLAGGLTPTVTLKELNRTFLDLGAGHEWYLWGNAGCAGARWRVGCDSGGRWGSAKADFSEIQHRTDVIGGVWVAAHTDLEYPCCGCCILQVGFRVQYDYTWSDILQIQNKSDVQDISILFSVGVRF